MFLFFLKVDSFPLDQGDIEEIPDSCSDSCDNEVDDNDEEDDEDDEDDDEDDDDEDDIIPCSPDVPEKFLLDDPPSDLDTDQVQTKARLEALLEAAGEFSEGIFIFEYMYLEFVLSNEKEKCIILIVYFLRSSKIMYHFFSKYVPRKTPGH